MKHGIYLITRGSGTPGEYQLLRQHAYNNRFAGYKTANYRDESWTGDFWNTYQVRPYIVWGQAGTLYTDDYGVVRVKDTDPQYLKVADYYPSGWSSWANLWYFVQDDGVFGLQGTKHVRISPWGTVASLYPTMGPHGRFLFPTPAGAGTITKVSVWAEINGAAKTVLRIGSTDYYGSYEDNNAKLAWIHTDYVTNPATGAAWTWANLAGGKLIAGVWLETGYIQTAHVPGNLIATNYVGASSICTRVKVRIDFINNGVASFVEIWPNWDSQCDDLAIWVGDIFSLDKSPLYEGVESPRFIFSGPIDGNIESDVVTYPDSTIIDQVKIKYDVYSRTYYETHTVKPYLLIGGVKYYGTTTTLPICPSTAPANTQSMRHLDPRNILASTQAEYTWATNPATGAAWTKAAIRALRYGLDFVKSATPVYVKPEFFVRRMEFETKYNGSSYTTNTHGSLSGSALTPSHCYPGYESKSTGKVRRWHSNVGEMPPGDLAIGKVRIYFNYRSFSQSGTNYVRPFIYAHGTYHYGTKQSIRSDPHILDQCSYEWPAGTFSASELANCTWGLEFYCSSLGWLWPTVLDIEFEHASMKNQATYSLLSARFLSLEKNFQVPITPDILKFAAEVFIPERAEVAYFWNGACVFQGLVWAITERAEDYTITAKSQQVLLEHRALPEIHSTIVSGSSVQYIHPSFRPLWYDMGSYEYYASPYNSLGDILSSDRPSHLFHQFNAACSVVMPVGDWIEATDSRRLGRYVHLVESNLGALYTANSYVPPGAADGVTLRGIAPHLWNRPLYTFGKNVSPIQNDFTSPAALVKGPNPPGSGEYHLGTEDLTLNSPVDTNILLADNWADTHIRARYIEHALEYLNQEYHFDSIASVFLNNLFTLLGQEVRFQPSGKGDAIVYMDVADMLCRGSETDPIQDYADGQDCKIEKTLPQNPLPALYVGQVGQNSPICAGSFEKRVGAILIGSTENNEKAVADEQDYLELALDDDTTEWKIRSTIEDPILNPGDWISADGVPIRIKRTIVTPQRTYIQAGKLKNVSTIWNDWAERLDRGWRTIKEIWPTLYVGVDTNNIGSGTAEVTVSQYAWLLQSKEFAFDGLTGSSAFTVKAADVKNDDWFCALEIGAKQEEGDPLDQMYHSGGGDVSKISKIGPARMEYRGTYTGDRPSRLDINVVEASDYYGAGPMWINIYYRLNYGSWTRFTGGRVTIYADTWLTFINGLEIRFVTLGTGSSPFTPNYPTEWWCTIEFAESGASEDPTIKLDFLKVLVNGKVIPPGRIPAKSNISLDISEHCSTSTAADTSNTVSVKAIGESAGFNCAVKQYRRTKLIANG